MQVITSFATVSITYEVITPESGEYAESGFDSQDEGMSLAELTDAIKRGGFYHGSDSGDAPCWISTDPDINYRTGEVTIRNLHINRIFGQQPTPRQLARIYKAAGLRLK